MRQVLRQMIVNDQGDGRGRNQIRHDPIRDPESKKQAYSPADTGEGNQPARRKPELLSGPVAKGRKAGDITPAADDGKLNQVNDHHAVKQYRQQAEKIPGGLHFRLQGVQRRDQRLLRGRTEQLVFPEGQRRIRVEGIVRNPVFLQIRPQFSDLHKHRK